MAAAGDGCDQMAARQPVAADPVRCKARATRSPRQALEDALNLSGSSAALSGRAPAPLSRVAARQTPRGWEDAREKSRRDAQQWQ